MNAVQDDMSEMKLKSVVFRPLSLHSCWRAATGARTNRPLCLTRSRSLQRMPRSQPPAKTTCPRASTGSTATSTRRLRPPGRPTSRCSCTGAPSGARPAHRSRRRSSASANSRKSSRLFVPVYLDGDTPSAQKYGERFRRGRLPDDDPVQAGRDGNHAPAGRRRRRTLRKDSRRRARRRAPRQRYPCGRAQRWRRHIERLEAARVLLLEHRRRPRAAGRPATGRLPRTRASLSR